MKIALDIGGVLGPSLRERESLDGTYSLQPGPSEGDRLAIMNLLFSGDAEVYIISRASSSEKVAANWAWLWEHFRDLPIPAANIHIFDGPRGKKAELVRAIGIEVVVDDRYEVLAAMPSGVKLFAYNPDPEEERMFGQGVNAQKVESLSDVVGYLFG